MGCSIAFTPQKNKQNEHSYSMQKLHSDSVTPKNNDKTKHVKLINDRVLGRLHCQAHGSECLIVQQMFILPTKS